MSVFSEIGKRTGAWLKRFVRHQGGNTAMIFALSSIGLLSAGGAGIDLGRALVVKARMAEALDAAALAVGGTNGLSNTQLTTMAQQYFTANYPSGTLGTPGTVSVVVSGQNISLSVSGSVPTALLQVAGINTLNVSVTNQVIRSTSRMRVALVLDNTGSMADDGKIDALKTATHNLLTQLQTAAVNNGDVYVSIIPFSRDVNVGSSNYNQSWVDFTDWDANNGSWDTNTICYHHSYCSCSGYSNCSCSGFGSLKACYQDVWTPDDHSTWNGCVMDRDQDYDTLNTAPSTGNSHTLFPADQYNSCSESVLALTYNWTTLSNKVDAMTPTGNTNQAIGLAWGWQSLSNPPLTVPAETTGYQYQHVIILLTDGLNTQNRWTSTQSSIDAREAITCTNAKNAGYIIYTVQVNTGGDPTSTMLQNCATDANKFFLLTSSTQIVSTFSTIGTQLANLHLSR